MKQDLTKIHAQAIQRQVQTKHIEKNEELSS